MNLSKLTEARVAKDLDSYAIKLIAADSDMPCLTMLLNGSVPPANSIRAWRALRSKHGDMTFFDAEGADAGDALFSFSDA